MKLRVISPEGHWAEETQIIRALVSEGLQHYHCRKPKLSHAEYLAYWEALPDDCRAQLVWHRPKSNQKMPSNAQQVHGDGLDFSLGILSSKSCHSMAEFNAAQGYHSAFFSPVFDSLSKSNYPAMGNLEAQLAERQNFETQLCALGGVQTQHLPWLAEKGFEQAALMGALWQNNQPVNYFKSCMKIAHLY
jgi:thiamine-phosphate pyrophosphorylase